MLFCRHGKRWEGGHRAARKTERRVGERESFRRRGITGACGLSTAIGHLPASRKAGQPQMARGVVSRAALRGGFCISHWIAQEPTLPDCHDCLSATSLRLASGYSVPDCQFYCWLGPAGVYTSVLFCCVGHSGPIQHPALSRPRQLPRSPRQIAEIDRAM